MRSSLALGKAWRRESRALSMSTSRRRAPALGRHRLWIERATGTPKSAPDRHYTIEISCSLLKKAAVCWMAMAADATALAVFEHGAVTLEDDLPAALVPAEAFAVKPS